MTINEKICKVRQMMEKNHIDACIIPGADPHMSEYFPAQWGTVTYMSGFTGEAGTFVITKDMAGLWTDGRYYIQAEAELAAGEGVLFKASEPETPSIKKYLKENLPEGAVVGVNGRLFSASYIKGLQKEWAEKKITIDTHVDYANQVWDGDGRPQEVFTEVYDLPIEFCGKSAADKLTEVRKSLKDKKADALVVSKLDNVAWLFNVRASDVKCNPVLTAYAYVDQTRAVLYTEGSRVPASVQETLKGNGVELRPYEAVFEDLASMEEKLTVACDENELNFNIYEAAAGNKALKTENITDPIPLMKACKNETETKNTFKAYLYDGCAEAEFYGWLFEELEAGHEFDEWELAQKLLSFRKEQPDFKEDSFDPILAYRENAAMMHYGPKPGSAKKIQRSHLLLNDSGGQYLWGTTDTTRTVALGEITEEERHDFTIVLKSVIALSTACWKEGTTGRDLDILSRNNLWQLGLDYRCGTGHGVGYLLNVHEGPQSFRNSEPLKEGMVLTIEPGIYTEGSHGIRTENAAVIRKSEKTEYGQFYHFETFTLVPIDTKCLDLALMNDVEIRWLNEYHAHVYDMVSPHVSDRAKKWLYEATRPVSR